MMQISANEVVFDIDHAGHIGDDSAMRIVRHGVADDAGGSPLRGIGDMNAPAIRRVGRLNRIMANIGGRKPYLDAGETTAVDDIVAYRHILAAGHVDCHTCRR